MTPEIQALLVASDHPTACESPPDFRREDELQRVRALMPTLQRLAGVELTLDDQVQDASFFCDVGGYREVQPRMFYPVILVRFSAFGHLVTITSDDVVAPSTIASLITALGDAGFTYVPADELDEPYTGRNPNIRDASWWIRFFDYL
jgi:hypothetical protein